MRSVLILALSLGALACTMGPGAAARSEAARPTAQATPVTRIEPLAGDRTTLESELQDLLALLPGRYVGVDGNGQRLFHKIAPIVAPQFGVTVFYHQVSRDGFDSLEPAQQKIYVFDRAPDRQFNGMRSFVFYPKQGYANFERDVEALRSVQPAMLMSFPSTCGVRWQQGKLPGQFIARSRSDTCSFQGAVFKQRIRPDMTYVLDADSFSVEDLLYGENGQPLFPRTGLLRALRQPR